MPKKILIVDDDAKNLKLVKDILGANGYATFEAVNGKEAIELAVKQIPDSIIMDIQMPVMDGLSALKILKTRDDTKHIPIIVVTAQSMKGDKESVLLSGADDYLSKPISVKILLELTKKYTTYKESSD